MSEPPVLYEVVDRVAVITLNRPDVRNAFGGAMGDALSDAFRRSDADDGVRVVVLTGTPPAFCAGADMSAGADTFARRDEETFSAGATTMPAWEVRKLVIAAVNGHAIGIGLTLTLQCDIRIFAADATYGIVQTRRGVMGDGYSHWTLPRLVGQSASAEILLTGQTFDGPRAKDLGLCSRVLPNAEVLPAALELAADVAAHTAPVSVAVSKRLLWQSWDLTREQTEKYETALHHHLMGRADAREGVLAYLERRAAQWQGSPTTDFPAWPDL